MKIQMLIIKDLLVLRQGTAGGSALLNFRSKINVLVYVLDKKHPLYLAVVRH